MKHAKSFLFREVNGNEIIFFSENEALLLRLELMDLDYDESLKWNQNMTWRVVWLWWINFSPSLWFVNFLKETVDPISIDSR